MSNSGSNVVINGSNVVVNGSNERRQGFLATIKCPICLDEDTVVSIHLLSYFQLFLAIFKTFLILCSPIIINFLKYILLKFAFSLI